MKYAVKRPTLSGGGVLIGAGYGGLYYAPNREAALKFGDNESAEGFMDYCRGLGQPKMLPGQADRLEVVEVGE